MSYIKERESTHKYKVNRLSKEEMDSMIHLCVHEQPAYCVAQCPFKLDTKAMLKAAAAGNFKKALQLYEKVAPFPGILAYGCEAPCEAKCKLQEVGDGIAIKEIEAALAAYGERTKASSVFRMKKKQSVAVFGSDMFCLLLSGELEKKAYPLTIFCEEKDIEQFLKKAAPFLDEEAFWAELKHLKKLDIQFEYGCELTPEFIQERGREFAQLCISDKYIKDCYPDAQFDESLMLYEKERIVSGKCDTVMSAAIGAKRAALTVDRLVQNVDPRNMRGEEGSVETKLYTSLDQAKNLTRVEKTGRLYTKEQAIEEAKRCIQCQCDECLKGCSYLAHYKKHPGLLAREIYNNTQIIMGDHQMNKPMNSCSLCGQCTVVCPNGFDMERVCRMARENMVSTDKMPLAPHEFALLDMMFSNNEAFLSRKQPGTEECKYVFFPGCQATAIAPETVKAAYTDLCERLEGGVALMLGCCGSICDWAGRHEMYEDTRKFLDAELAKLGDPIVIAGCPTCKKKLLGHDGIEIVGIWDILKKIGLPENCKSIERPVALHDSCGARGDARTQEAIRSIAEQLGCKLVDTEYTGDRSLCCGYGGLTAYANREVAREMTQKCLGRADVPYISYCMACRDRFAREGRESHHILELVYGTDAGSPPNISEKRYHRLTLKEDLLQNLWGEEVEKVNLDFELEFTEEALKMMDDRLILKSDVIKVMEDIRETQEAIEDMETGLLIGRKRIGNVTFWVKFTEDGENKYIIRGAYSHRMKIERRL